MKYLSIDVETTGLDPDHCSVIEFAAVLEDSRDSSIPIGQLPFFHAYIKEPSYTGEPYALGLNGEIFKIIGNAKGPDETTTRENPRILRAAWLHQELYRWLAMDCGFVPTGDEPLSLNAAGKNFAAFDLQFLSRMADYGKYVKFRHRSLDPTIFFFEPGSDEKMPDTAECLKRAGITLADGLSHRAVDDARLVIMLLRYCFERREKFLRTGGSMRRW